MSGILNLITKISKEVESNNSSWSYNIINICVNEIGSLTAHIRLIIHNDRQYSIDGYAISNNDPSDLSVELLSLQEKALQQAFLIYQGMNIKEDNTTKNKVEKQIEKEPNTPINNINKNTKKNKINEKREKQVKGLAQKYGLTIDQSNALFDICIKFKISGSSGMTKYIQAWNNNAKSINDLTKENADSFISFMENNDGFKQDELS